MTPGPRKCTQRLGECTGGRPFGASLILIRRGLPPMDFAVAWPAQGNQMARALLIHADICEVMHLGRAPLAAFLADVVGALQDVLAPLALDRPVIRGNAI